MLRLSTFAILALPVLTQAIPNPLSNRDLRCTAGTLQCCAAVKVKCVLIYEELTVMNESVP